MMNQSDILKQIDEENSFLGHFLISDSFASLKDAILADAQPLSEDFWLQTSYLDRQSKSRWLNPKVSLRLIERESPLLLHRDLAACALMRIGEWSPQRADRLSGMMVYDLEEDERNLSFEATFALTHWRSWHHSLSKWFDHNRFIHICEVALNEPAYQIWAAYSFIWALHKAGNPLHPENAEYRSLLAALGGLLQKGAEPHQPKELQVAANIALGKLTDWQKTPESVIELL